MSRGRQLLLACAGLLPGLCAAQPSLAPLAQVWVNPGFYSYHFDRDAGLQNANPGLGIEWPLDNTFSLTAGAFRNSEREHSNYLGVYVMPFEWQGIKFGAAVGFFDGYPRMRDGGWFPALIPVMAIERGHWGLNIGLVPEYKDRLHGAITFQLKFRFEAPPLAER